MAETAKTRSVVQKLEVIANICIIAAAVVFVLSVSWFFLRYSSSLRSPRSSIQRGTKITLLDVDWSASPQTLLLVLSTECKYCTASTPFYRRLVNQAALTHNTRLIAIFPQAINESKEYFAQQEVKIDKLQQAAPASVGVKGTPTLMLVSASGVVIQSWEGMLPSHAESEVLAAMK